MSPRPQPDTTVVEANGISFHCLTMGSGPLVLALHGFPDLPWTFSDQMPMLADVGFRVVAPHMRGYHPTDLAPDGNYERAALGQDILALMDALSDEPVVLLGHDWGASAAYLAAGAAPDRVARLVTIAVPYRGAWGEALFANAEQQRRSWYMFFFQMTFAESAVERDDFAFIERLWGDWSPGWEFPVDDLRAVKDTLARPGVLTAALSYYRHTFTPDKQDPALGWLREVRDRPIAVPTLYIHGQRDGGIGVENVEGMEESFTAGLEKHVVPGAGHFVHRERPDVVNPLIERFLRSG